MQTSKKRNILLIIAVLICINIFAQSPGAFKYQAVARDISGNIMANEAVNFAISIIQGGTAGPVAYSEVFNTTTNSFGLVNLDIGLGNPASFSAVDWSQGPFFIKIELNGELMGVSQILSVPFALYSNYSGDHVNLTGTGSINITGSYPDLTINGTDEVDDADSDPANELQVLSVSAMGDTLSLTPGNSVVVPGISRANESYTGLLATICRIENNTTFFKNVMYFNKAAIGVADSIKVYKETASDELTLLYSIPFSEDSLIMYNSYPTTYTEKYFISTVKNGFESVLSPYHKSLSYFTSQGNISSTINIHINPYENEIDDKYVSKYYIYRGTTPMNLQLLDSVPSYAHTYVDQNVFSTYFYHVIPVFKPCEW